MSNAIIVSLSFTLLGVALTLILPTIYEFASLRVKVLFPGRRIKHFRKWLVGSQGLKAKRSSGFIPRTKFYEAEIASSLMQKTAGGGKPHGDSTDKTDSGLAARALRVPTYYYFVDTLLDDGKESGSSPPPNEGIALQRFEAFLIPELDNGHSGRSFEDLRELAFSKSRVGRRWKRYLTEMGAKVAASKKSGDLESARRVIFFDKYLANLILFDLERLVEPIRPISPDRLAVRPPDNDRLTLMTYFAIQRAMDLIVIHRALAGSASEVDTRYVDKARIRSNQFYDYGPYKFNGVEVVYQPIYRKGFGREVVRERIFLGENLLQNSQIKEFSRDFESVWSGSAYRTTDEDISNDALLLEQRSELSQPPQPPGERLTSWEPKEDSCYYRTEGNDAVAVYDFHYFGKGYIDNLEAVLGETLEIKGDAYL